MSRTTEERRRRIKELIENNRLSFDFFYSNFKTPASTYNKWKAGVSAPRENDLIEIEKFLASGNATVKSDQIMEDTKMKEMMRISEELGIYKERCRVLEIENTSLKKKNKSPTR